MTPPYHLDDKALSRCPGRACTSNRPTEWRTSNGR